MRRNLVSSLVGGVVATLAAIPYVSSRSLAGVTLHNPATSAGAFVQTGANLRSKTSVPSDFRGTFGNALSGVLSAVSPNSCLADLFNTGYSNDLYKEDDYPFQPSCYVGGEANSIICLPGSTEVITELHGPKKMEELQIGDRILAQNMKDGKSTLEFSPVLFFLHRDRSRDGIEWIRLTHALGSLTLSPTHMTFKYKSDGSLSSIAAKRVKNGDLLSVLHEGKLVKSVVVDVASVHSSDRDGIYAPVTNFGTLIADGVVTSSYSSVDAFGADEGNAHAVLDFAASPLKLLSRYPLVAKSLDRGVSLFRGSWRRVLSFAGFDADKRTRRPAAEHGGEGGAMRELLGGLEGCFVHLRALQAQLALLVNSKVLL